MEPDQYKTLIVLLAMTHQPSVINGVTRPSAIPLHLFLLSPSVMRWASPLLRFAIAYSTLCLLDLGVHRGTPREMAVHGDPRCLLQALPAAEHRPGSLHGQQK